MFCFGTFQAKQKCFSKFFSRQFALIYLKAKASPGLGLQSKHWKKRLRLGPLVPTGLTQGEM